MTRKALSASKKARPSKRKAVQGTVEGELIQAPKLTPKQQRFVDEYLVDLNGRRAYQAAFPGCKSELAARVEASKLLTNPNIAKIIEFHRDRLSKQIQVTRAEIVREFRRIGISANSEDYFSFSKNGVVLKDSSQLTREQMGMISEISHTQTEYGANIRVKLHDKLSALNSLAKHLGMFPTRVEQGIVQVPVQFNIVIRPTRGQE